MQKIKIANDLVCLQSFPISKGYLFKISYASEIKLMFQADVNLCITGVLFSIKEAAYKVMMKYGLEKAFSPKKYRILSCLASIKYNTQWYEGIVSYEGNEMLYKTMIRNKYCHSIVSFEKECKQKLDLDIRRYNSLTIENQEQIAHRQIINQLKKQVPSSKELSIKKDVNGIPHAYSSDKILPLELSISHDGSFVATLIYKDE